MNPIKSVGAAIAKPATCATGVLLRPTGTGRNRPFYGLNVLDMIRGGTLEDAVRDHISRVPGLDGGQRATRRVDGRAHEQ